jgi:hypothetical protein
MKVQLSGGRKTFALVLLAATTDSGAPAPHHVVRHIHLSERELNTEIVDLGAPGHSIGDRIEITSEISDAHGTVIGRADFDCAVTALGKRAGGICSGVVSLPGGQLTGTFFEPIAGPPPEPNLQAITGGTGEFEGAHGQFIVGRETTRFTPFVVELVS